MLIGCGPRRVGAHRDCARPPAAPPGPAATTGPQAGPGLSGHSRFAVRIRDAARRVEELQALTEGALMGAYRFDRYLTGDQASAGVARWLADLSRAADRPPPLAARWAEAQETARAGWRMAARPGQRPAAVMTPTRLAETGASWPAAPPGDHRARPDGVPPARHGPFSPLSPRAATRNRASFTWRGSRPPRGKRIVLVGKGVTSDSGGLSLKNQRRHAGH